MKVVWKDTMVKICGHKVGSHRSQTCVRKPRQIKDIRAQTLVGPETEISDKKCARGSG